MSSKVETAATPANLVNVQLNAVESGSLVVRLEYVTSQDHIDRIRRGEAKADILEVLMKPQQARKIAEGLVRQADLLEASLKPGAGQSAQ